MPDGMEVAEEGEQRGEPGNEAATTGCFLHAWRPLLSLPSPWTGCDASGCGGGSGQAASVHQADVRRKGGGRRSFFNEQFLTNRWHYV
jgi:hypothetical protein